MKHTFPVDGEYTIKVRLWRNTFDLMRGMEDPHQIEISLDGVRVRLITVGGWEEVKKMAENPGSFDADVDQKLTVRLPVKAGERTISATTILRSEAVKDDLIKPFMRTTVDGLDITGDPSVDRLTVDGPFNQTGPGDTASRRKIFVCQPAAAKDELALRAPNPFRAGAPRISPPAEGQRSRRSAQFLPAPPQQQRQL